MRNLTTSLALLALFTPFSALAQEDVTLEETPEAGDAAPAEPAEPAPAPAAEPAPPADAGGGAAASASTSAGFQASGTTAPAPAAATSPVPEAEPEVNRPSAARQTGPAGSDTWEMSYSGYLRAPLRVGMGNNTGPQHIREAQDGGFENADGQPVTHDPVTNAPTGLADKRLTLHMPVVPDSQYGSWQNTMHYQSEWAEMFFSVGNGTVSGTLALQGFQFTDSAWKEDAAQFGIGQGWVEVNDDLGFENVKFNVKVGSHWARYGMAGVYDGGEYDTYLFGRTHTLGGTARVDLLLSSFDLAFEGGVGGKQPNPEMFNRARFTMLGHGHMFLKFPSVEFSLNAMHAWASQEVVPLYPNVLPGSGGCDFANPGAQCTTADDQIAPPDGTEQYGGVDGQNGVYGPEYPTGKQTVLGADARVDLGLLGYLYAGYSHQLLKNSLTVGGAIESIHSFGAAEFQGGVVDNYLESPYCLSNINESCSNGTGQVGTIVAQYELGLANFGIFPGNMDLKAKLYTMINFVSVDDVEVERLDTTWGAFLADPAANINGVTMDDLRQDGTTKMKFGTDLEFFPIDWMSAGVRFDRLDPHSKMENEGFSILSPRVSFRSKMVTHEEIMIQYSRYMYDQRMCEDSAGNVSSPADDPYRQGSIFGGASVDTGMPLRYDCVQPPPAGSGSGGFGQTQNTQAPGRRAAPTLIPDENVITLSATMWW